MADEGMKVTDKRMFTPEGELREEYRFLEERAELPPETAAQQRERRQQQAPEDAPPAGPEAAPPAGPEAAPGRAPAAGAPEGRAGGEVPGYEEARPAGEAPAFFDLLGVLAEPIPFYLGDTRLPTGEAGENLEAARFYIDLLEVLRRTTEGNLTAQEADALEDLLYRLRLRYVQKRR